MNEASAPAPARGGASAPLPVELLLVYGSLRTGGIETMIVRIANYFSQSGVRVSVFCPAGGELEPLLDDRVHIVPYEETGDLVTAVQARRRNGEASGGVLIISFDPFSAARALMVESHLPRELRAAHVSGVFHPRAYFMTGERADRVFLNQLLALAIGKNRLFFMNEDCRKTHSQKWKTDLSGSSIIALPINWTDAVWKSSRGPTLRLISVGRLVDFKAYNLGAPRIVKECRDRGFDVTWDIFGDGPLHDAIHNAIDEAGVADRVRLMGNLDYSNFSSTVSGYDLFLGVGTAALEAAMLGVPTICGTEHETLCYGYLDELPFGNLGELQHAPPTVEIGELIRRYFAADDAERSRLSSQCRSAAERYGMPSFSEAIARMAGAERASPPKRVKRAVAELYRFATESAAIKAVRRHVGRDARRA